MEDLIDFTACLWQTASLGREELAVVRARAASHAGPAVLVESCQRLEAYSLGQCGCPAQTQLRSAAALFHLASVAAGLHSVVLGEEQVMGQVRAALAEAPAALRELGDIAVAAARELRRNVNFNTHSGHLLDRAMAMAAREPGGSVLVLGTGHMARLVARRALDLGFEQVTVAGRQKPVGAWFDESRLSFLPLDVITSCAAVDIVIGCLGADAPPVDVATGLPLVRGLLVDLGTPRNFRGTAAVRVLGISDLLDTGHREGVERREELASELRSILDHRIEMARTNRQTPVGALRASVERVRQREMNRIQKLHPEIPEETIEAITRSLVNQLFHRPSERLKSLDDPSLGERFAALFSEERDAELQAIGGPG